MNKKNYICCIFCAGELYENNIDIPENAFIIAADGGLRHTKKLGISPDIILGDFDSTKKPDCDCIVYPTEKDYTDSFLAVDYAYNNGFRSIRMYGCLGGTRIEHTVANIAMLEHFAKLDCDVTLFGDNQCIYAVHTANKIKTLCFDEDSKGYISVFAIGEQVSGLTINGLKYELSDYCLTTAIPLGISNEFTGKPAEISFRNGTLMVICGNCKK